MTFISASPPVTQFFQSILLGALLGVLYDVFYAIRALFPRRKQPHIALDLLYFLLFGILLFNYLLMESAGRLRYFIVLGVIAGWVIYHNTISRITIRFLNWLFGLLRKLLKFLVRPFLSFGRHLSHIGVTIRKKCSAAYNSQKNRLKKPHSLLYNKLSKSRVEEIRNEKSDENRNL